MGEGNRRGQERRKEIDCGKKVRTKKLYGRTIKSRSPTRRPNHRRRPPRTNKTTLQVHILCSRHDNKGSHKTYEWKKKKIGRVQHAHTHKHKHTSRISKIIHTSRISKKIHRATQHDSRKHKTHEAHDDHTSQDRRTEITHARRF